MFWKKKKYKSFYHMPFKAAKRFLPRLFLDLKFLKDMNLDVKTFDLKVLEGQSVRPVFVVENKDLSPYLKMEDQEAYSEPIDDKDLFLLGYKHFDRFKRPNGELMGDVHNNHYKEWINSNKLKKSIQRRVLGWKYWIYRITGKLK
jgi:hypothetical protein